MRNKNIVLSLGRWTKEGLDHLLQESSDIHDAGERIAFLSKHFLGVAYKEPTLIGGINIPEVFIVNLEGMDCMTFTEYIEAMRLSNSFSEFMENLKKVRYFLGKVTFETRNHFFTDWLESNSRFIADATEPIGGAKTVKVKKRLNLKKDGTYILPGIAVKEREIKFIPADVIDGAVLDKLKTGDYAGMYSKDDGLDVSHVGVIIQTQGATFLRHASSIARKVVDEDFKKYIYKKEGLVVLRPCKQGSVSRIVGKVAKKEKKY
ncbi:MAG: DUF1460 domain-containing protein [Deltaproteobacteria bacterium]|nr:DUF1460 domain-containing protein [Deltaproteobacteria bacterium]